MPKTYAGTLGLSGVGGGLVDDDLAAVAAGLVEPAVVGQRLAQRAVVLRAAPVLAGDLRHRRHGRELGDGQVGGVHQRGRVRVDLPVQVLPVRAQTAGRRRRCDRRRCADCQTPPSLPIAMCWVSLGWKAIAWKSGCRS